MTRVLFKQEAAVFRVVPTLELPVRVPCAAAGQRVYKAQPVILSAVLKVKVSGVQSHWEAN